MAGNSRLFLSVFILTIFSALTVFADSIHVVAKGETLYSLARKYDVTLEVLLARNGISNPSGLRSGTKLVIPGIPAPQSGEKRYMVKKGDTYYSIAKRFKLDVDTLLTMNARETSDVLRIGETLIVAREGIERLAPPAERITVGVGSQSSLSSVVSDVPWWPVAGYMKPLEGKLAGVSIETEPLSYVHAVARGHVVWTGPYRGFGHVVLVDSNGYIYLYGGNKDLFVNVGQTVTAGSRIGRLGPSGPGGDKLDMIFSVFREGVPVSPAKAPRG